MAGTVSMTVTTVPNGLGTLQYSMQWTSNAAGAVSGNSLLFNGGTIVCVEFIPGTGNSQPSNNYSVDFQDPLGVSAFNDGAGAGGNIGSSLSNTTASRKVSLLNGASSAYRPLWVSGGSGYQLIVSAAGNAKSGTVNIFITPGVP